MKGIIDLNTDNFFFFFVDCSETIHFSGTHI